MTRTLKAAFEEAVKYLRAHDCPVARFVAYRGPEGDLYLREDPDQRFALYVSGPEGHAQLTDLAAGDVTLLFHALADNKPYAHQADHALYNLLPGSPSDKQGLTGVMVFRAEAHTLLPVRIPYKIIRSLAASLFDLDCFLGLPGTRAGWLLLGPHRLGVGLNHRRRFYLGPAPPLVDDTEYTLDARALAYLVKSLGTFGAAVRGGE